MTSRCGATDGPGLGMTTRRPRRPCWSKVTTEECQGLTAHLRSLKVPYILTEELPVVRPARPGVDLREIPVDAVESGRRCQRIEVAGEREMGPRSDQGVDLTGGEVFEQ